MLTHLSFIVFVAIAVYVQNLTGFAFALILLGLVGTIDLVPLPDAVNAVTALSVVNALMFFYRRRTARIERAILPAVAASLVTVVVGIALVTFLAASAYQVLRLVLGLSVVACALLLWRAASPLKSTSSASYFTFVGSLSGVLGGMFAAAGPPLVYAVYRQPWPLERIQESLIFSFAAGALLRMVVIVFTGNFSSLSLLLTLEAIPVALMVTALNANRPAPFSKKAIRNAVCALLVLSGLGMLISSLQAMFG
ncbi:MAG: TSUP family transporter [Pigmentiphaga sp.]